MEQNIITCRNHIPNKQYELYKRAIAMTGKTMSEDELKNMIATLIITNPICSGCLKKDKNTLLQLKLCSNCCLDHYCSEQCRQNHLNVHSKYCNDINGDFPFDSPFAPAICKTKPIVK